MRGILYLFSLVANVFVIGSNAESVYETVYPNDLSYETHLTDLDLEETCNVLKNEHECYSNNKCSWCISGAVKSQCHSLENAERLPQSIFHCNGLSSYSDVGSFIDDYISDNFVSLEWHPRWVDFLDFIKCFNKEYNVNDIESRFNNFLKNLDFIEHNEYSFKLGLNSYADLSQEEFQHFVKSGGYGNKNQMIDIKRNLLRVDRTSSCSAFKSKMLASSLPSSIDWREKNAVTAVKDQGHCGSCWSFSATGSMEGAWAIKTGNLLSFSEQQLIDCSTLYGNSGCSGGLMENGFDYAIDKGMCNESELPYKAVDGLCSECNKVAHFSGCVDVTSSNQLHLQEALSYGPVSVAIEADTLVFQFYKSGVINDVKCGTNLDHGVLVVGYGTEDGNDYWIVKNSWGPGWGDNGYVKIGRSNSTSDAGMCGIALQPSYIVV